MPREVSAFTADLQNPTNGRRQNTSIQVGDFLLRVSQRACSVVLVMTRVGGRSVCARTLSLTWPAPCCHVSEAAPDVGIEAEVVEQPQRHHDERLARARHEPDEASRHSALSRTVFVLLQNLRKQVARNTRVLLGRGLADILIGQRGGSGRRRGSGCSCVLRLCRSCPPSLRPCRRWLNLCQTRTQRAKNGAACSACLLAHGTGFCFTPRIGVCTRSASPVLISPLFVVATLMK